MTRTLTAVAFAITTALPASAQTAPPPAARAETQAAAVDAAGAQAIAAALTGEMPLFAAMMDAGLRLQWRGQTLVVPQGDRYAVALAPFALVGGDGAGAAVESIRLELTPRPDGAFGVTATVPTAIALNNAKGETVGAITIGRQQVSAVWVPALLTTVAADVRLGDLKIHAQDAEVGIELGSVSFTQDLQPDGGSLYSGPAGYALADLSVTNEEGEPVLSMRGFTVEGTLTRIDLARVAAVYRAQLDRLRGGGRVEPNAMLSAINGTFAGLDGRLRLTGVTVRDDSEDEDEDGEEADAGEITLDHLAVGLGVSGLDGDRGAMTVTVEAEGLGGVPAEGVESFVPRRAELRLSVAGIPSAHLSSLMSDTAKPVHDEVLTAAFKAAGTRLVLDRLLLDLPVAQAAVNGTAAFAPSAALGGTGSATVTLTGLDAAAKALQPKKGGRPDPDHQEALGAIAMLQAMGQAGKDAQGRDVRTYRIEVTPAGEFLLNGADMAPLLGGLGAGPQPDPAPPAGPKVLRKQ